MDVNRGTRRGLDRHHAVSDLTVSGAMPASAAAIRPPLRVLPGLLLCVGVTGLAALLQRVEIRLAGEPYLEALVLAIVLGVIIRTAWTPGSRWSAGIQFSAKVLLEIAVVLLGASVSAATVLALGPALIVGIACVVAVALATSYGICRCLGLPPRMAILVACGNSICGNSAIAAVAPVIGADGDDVASSIAFTAVLGVIVVLALPSLVPLLRMSLTQYGILAGLTVYAVPQVLAATLPIGALSNQIGTVVKLVRVLMLGPVVLGLSLITSRLRVPTEIRASIGPAFSPGADMRADARISIEPPREAPEQTAPREPPAARRQGGRPPLPELVPRFIIGFLLVAAARSFGIIPQAMLVPLATTASVLTTISMAALGLGVDVRVVAKAGGRVTAAVCLSLIVLGLISLALIHGLGVA